jgi:hypothetical protein
MLACRRPPAEPRNDEVHSRGDAMHPRATAGSFAARQGRRKRLGGAPTERRTMAVKALGLA